MDRKLSSAIKIAKEKGMNWESLEISKVSGKRFSIRSPSGKLINFGQWPLVNGTFLDHSNEQVRTAWRARHKKILKDGKPAYLNPESPEYYSWNLLW